MSCPRPSPAACPPLMALGETWPYWPPLPTDGSLPQPIGFLPFPYPLRDEQSRCFRVLITVAIGLAEVILAIYIELHRKTNIKGKTKTSTSILMLPGIWSRVSHFRHALWFIMKIVPKMCGQNVEASSLTYSMKCSFSSSFSIGKLISVNCPSHAH